MGVGGCLHSSQDRDGLVLVLVFVVLFLGFSSHWLAGLAWGGEVIEMR